MALLLSSIRLGLLINNCVAITLAFSVLHCTMELRYPGVLKSPWSMLTVTDQLWVFVWFSSLPCCFHIQWRVYFIPLHLSLSGSLVYSAYVSDEWPMSTVFRPVTHHTPLFHRSLPKPPFTRFNYSPTELC